MIDINSFSAKVVEVLNYIKQGSIMEREYTPNGDDKNVATDIKTILAEYLDQDINPPHFPLVGITQDASSEIPYPMDEPFRTLRRSLIEFSEQENFYKLIAPRILSIKEFSKDQAELIADAICNDLLLCASSRLLMTDSHPYFENMFSIYKRQGFPYGWLGQEDWKSGEFLIFSRPTTCTATS